MDRTAVDKSGAKQNKADDNAVRDGAAEVTVESNGTEAEDGDGDDAGSESRSESQGEVTVEAPVETEAAAEAAEHSEEPEAALPTPARLRDQEPLTDRELGVRVITFVIAICVLVAGWAVLKVRVDDSGRSGSDLATPTASRTVPAAAAPPKLVQQIPSSYTIPGSAPSLPWPSGGQAAVEVEGIGSLGTSGGTSRPVPIASVTKTMTAYLILAHHPLSNGQSGPSMTVTAAEAGAYAAEFNAGQSLIKIYAGEKLTERDALEALMLASADNVAKILARWDAGSVSAFVSSMNKAAAKLGMTHTTYTDPSGLDPATVSTATDQIKLGRAAMQSATFRQIVAEQSATVAKQDTIKNYNALLGESGVIGIKTGSTSQAGGCLLFAATVTVGGRTETLIGAVLGQPLSNGSDFLARTLTVSGKLIVVAERSVVAATIAAPGTQVASVHRAGHPEVRLGVAAAVTVVGWPGLTYSVSVSGAPSAAATLEVTAADSAGIASSTTSGSTSLVPLFSGGAAVAE